MPSEILIKKQPTATDPQPAPCINAAGPSEPLSSSVGLWPWAGGLWGSFCFPGGRWEPGSAGAASLTKPFGKDFTVLAALAAGSARAQPGNLAHAVLGCCQLRAGHRCCCLLLGQQSSCIGSCGWTRRRRGSGAEPSKHQVIFLFLGVWH